jgi:hypothetical protein
VTADDREYEIEDDSPRLPSSAHRTRPVRIVTDEWVATHDAELVESIAAGFDARALQARINGALDPPGRDIDVVLAWECAARWIREHAGNRFPSPQGATAGPGGTPGAPTVDVEHLRELAGALNRMQRDYPLGYYVGFGAGILEAIGEPAGYMGKPITFEPATSPTGDPTP